MTALLLRVYRYLRPYWRLTGAAYLALLGVTIINLTVPQFIRWMIDNGIVAADSSLLAWSALGLLGLTLVKGVLTYIEGQFAEVASQSVAYDLRNAIQQKLTSLSFAFHDQAETGDLLARAVQDVERIRFLTGRATLRLMDGALTLVGTALALLWMQPGLALLVILTMPLLAWQALRFGRRFRPLSLQIQKQIGVLTSQVEQNLRGSRVVKAFAQEEAEIALFEQANRDWLALASEAARLQAIQAPLLILLANLGVVLVLWYGGSLVSSGALTLGVLVAFTAYLGQLVEPVRRLGMIIPAVAIASSSAERIFEILDSLPAVQETPGAQPLPALQGRVCFEDVSFSYAGEQKLAAVLQQISFQAQPGQVTALLGPTGSGKSTVISLIPRFYDPTVGRITVDGQDIRQATLHSLRSQIGIVMQETTLFSGSVRENLLFGRPDAGEAEMFAAAQAAQAHDFILQMPQGYDTRVGEKGVTLSGGQKQRIAIARALLMNPRILILDDATAAVDGKTESLIQQALDKLMEGRTTFVIAHRLSTVRRADQILLLDGGRIAARGKHAELLETSPLYRQIYERQLAVQAASDQAASDSRPLVQAERAQAEPAGRSQ